MTLKELRDALDAILKERPHLAKATVTAQVHHGTPTYCITKADKVQMKANAQGFPRLVINVS